MSLKSIENFQSQPKNHEAIIADLRKFINSEETKAAPRLPNRATWKTGLEEVDEALPVNNLCRNGVHEIVPCEFGDEAAATGFTLSLLKQYLDLEGRPQTGSILWCQNAESVHEAGRLHGSGIARFGIDPGRIMFAETDNTRDCLWVLEEAAKCSDLCAIIGEVKSASFTETRRLTLAAQEAGIPIFLIRDPKFLMGTNANTRWRVGAGIGQPDLFDAKAPGNPTWDVELLKCRGGRPNQWSLEWSYETHNFSVASQTFAQPFGNGDALYTEDKLVACA